MKRWRRHRLPQPLELRFELSHAGLDGVQIAGPARFLHLEGNGAQGLAAHICRHALDAVGLSFDA